MLLVCFATISLWALWAHEMLLVWMMVMLMRHLVIGNQLKPNQLILICTKGPDCFLITEISAGVMTLNTFLYHPFFAFNTFYLCELLPTSGKNFMSIAPLEIFLLKLVMLSILILPTVSIWESSHLLSINRCSCPFWRFKLQNLRLIYLLAWMN